LAYERGLLQSKDPSEVQEKLLRVYVTRKAEQKIQMEETRFEQDLLINQPEMYREWKKHQEENKENEDIVWGFPQSIEEAREIEKLIAQMEQQSVQTAKAPDEGVVIVDTLGNRLNTLEAIPGLDLDQLGETDG